jgi:hypothetical protein
MDIKFNEKNICNILIIVTILCSISTYGFTHSLAQGQQGEHKYYKVNNVKYVEDSTSLVDKNIDKYYRLSDIGLNNQETLQLMDEKDVIINDGSKLGKVGDDVTVALTINNGAYVGNMEANYTLQFYSPFLLMILNILLTTVIVFTTYVVGHVSRYDYDEQLSVIGTIFLVLIYHILAIMSTRALILLAT